VDAAAEERSVEQQQPQAWIQHPALTGQQFTHRCADMMWAVLGAETRPGREPEANLLQIGHIQRIGLQQPAAAGRTPSKSTRTLQPSQVSGACSLVALPDAELAGRCWTGKC